MKTISLTAVAACVVLFGAPAQAQTIDFGDDSSRWSNDGECDDPRFEGPGMTETVLLDSDAMHDATDCKAAYDAGMLTLVGSGRPPKGGARTPAAQMFDGINFGNDDGDWNNDGECDDRRFIGGGMAADLSWDHVGRDATDCLAFYQNGELSMWNFADATAATQCSAIDFGDDTGAYPEDFECDDRRFEGPAAAMLMSIENVRGDASDCSRLCDFGVIALREY